MGLPASPAASVGNMIGPRGQPLAPPWTSLQEARTTVGRRVRLWWGGDRRWYAGRIVLVHPTSRHVFIKYDDHDERWHAMWEARYEFVDAGAGGAAAKPGRADASTAAKGMPR